MCKMFVLICKMFVFICKMFWRNVQDVASRTIHLRLLRHGPAQPHQQSSAVIVQEPKAEHRKPKAGRTLCRIDRKLKRPFLAGLGLGPGPPKADRCDCFGSKEIKAFDE